MAAAVSETRPLCRVFCVWSERKEYFVAITNENAFRLAFALL